MAAAAIPKRILVTLGDPAGVGPEVVEAALREFDPPHDCRIEVIGDRAAGQAGKPDRKSATAALEALEFAAAELAAGRAHAVATAPVSKSGLQAVGFDFPGQTEFFAARLAAPFHAMCLTGERLTVALATIHVPLARVPSLLEPSSIARVGLLLAAFLRRRGVDHPRVAVCGLNPHAGEDGAFGDEETRVIAPAVRLLQTEDPAARFTGPHVPDAVFRDALDGQFDAVVAMYHDQGLIPFKMVDFDSGVNVTLGLPKPRVSPDHGTAFGIAGLGIARPHSMLRAIRLATELA